MTIIKTDLPRDVIEIMTIYQKIAQELETTRENHGDSSRAKNVVEKQSVGPERERERQRDGRRGKNGMANNFPKN